MRIAWGVVAALLVNSAAIGQTGADAPGSVLTAPGGRYVYGQVSTYARHQFMLDTQTGRLWVSKCIVEKFSDDKCLYQALEPVIYRDTEGKNFGVMPAQPSAK